MKKWKIETSSYTVFYEGETLPKHLEILGRVEEIISSGLEANDKQQKNNQTSLLQDTQEKQPPKKTRK